MTKMNEEETLGGNYSDFIGVYDGALSPGFCRAIIDTFDYHHNTNAVWDDGSQFPTKTAGRFNWSMDLQHMCNNIHWDRADRELNDVLYEHLEDYTDIFGHLKGSKFYTLTQKVQKTPAGGGYHVWHDENTDGGEHEFLYYKRRIKPKTGTLLIWPAGMTHAHRGGLVLSGCKYVVTGWFYVAPRFEE
jgi:hypothetical protein